MLKRIAMRSLPLLLGTNAKQRLSILIFHRVVPTHDPLRPDEPTVEEFDWQMRLLREYFSPLPLTEAVERLLAGDLPANAICVTFDDGYSDNETCAMPILRKYGVPATVFVSTGFLNGGRMWNDTIIEMLRHHDQPELDLRDIGLGCYRVSSNTLRLGAIASIIQEIRHLHPEVRGKLTAEIEKQGRELPNDLMMTDDQVCSLAKNGVSVGAHTVTHPILASIGIEAARQEILGSKTYLENLVQAPVDAFAYPNGRPEKDYRAEHRELVSELGFKTAVSTHWGVGVPQSDRLQLPRFTPWDRQEMKFAVRLLASYRQPDPLVSAGI
jgi:peptidoglycan/xylan/chitin deacetylase (PgdA/CDA1 family)